MSDQEKISGYKKSIESSPDLDDDPIKKFSENIHTTESISNIRASEVSLMFLREENIIESDINLEPRNRTTRGQTPRGTDVT